MVEGTNGGTNDTEVFEFSSSSFTIDQFVFPANVENVQLNLTLENGDVVRPTRVFSSFDLEGVGTVFGTDASEIFNVTGEDLENFSTTLDAGGGDDTISVTFSAVVSGGAGADTITISNGGFSQSPAGSNTIISGGADVDQYIINPRLGISAGVFRSYGDNTFTDFDPAAGERIVLGSAIAEDIPTVVSDVRDTVNGATVVLQDINAVNTYGGTITFTGVSAAQVQSDWFM